MHQSLKLLLQRLYPHLLALPRFAGLAKECWLQATEELYSCETVKRLSQNGVLPPIPCTQVNSTTLMGGDHNIVATFVITGTDLCALPASQHLNWLV